MTGIISNTGPICPYCGYEKEYPNDKRVRGALQAARDFKETIVERAKRDKKFRRGMLMRGIALIIAGDKDDVQAGKAFIRDYINATVGFPALSKRTGIPKESLMRMLGPSRPE